MTSQPLKLKSFFWPSPSNRAGERRPRREPSDVRREGEEADLWDVDLGGIGEVEPGSLEEQIWLELNALPPSRK